MNGSLRVKNINCRLQSYIVKSFSVTCVFLNLWIIFNRILRSPTLKTITSEYAAFRHKLRFFLFHVKLMLCSWDIQFFKFSNNFISSNSCDVMMSIITQVYVHLLHTVMGSILKKYFTRSPWLSHKARPFLIYQTTKNNQNPIISLGFFTVLKVCTEVLESSQHHLKKKLTNGIILPILHKLYFFVHKILCTKNWGS